MQETVRKVGRLFYASKLEKYTIDRMTMEHTEMMAMPTDETANADSNAAQKITFEWIPQGATENLVSLLFSTRALNWIELNWIELSCFTKNVHEILILIVQ